MPLKAVELYSDGACSGNPGPGGWAAILVYGATRRELSGGEKHTTNNRMELMAVIEGLKALKESCQVTATTDSRYVQDGISSWVAGWKRNGWMTKAKEPVKNRDLWEALDDQAARHEINWRWVRGHSGHELNEACDRLARQRIGELK